jgi:anti-sigma factor RsiW
MMSCNNMENRILAYVDGRLKETERAEMEKHLASCAVCSVQVTEFRAVNDLLGELPMVEPSPEFDVRVRARVAAEPVKQKQSWWSWAWPAPRVAFAATALLAATLFVAYRGVEVVAPPIPPDEADAQMIQDLSVIEDHDTLSNFEPLKELPPPVDANDDTQQQDM